MALHKRRRPRFKITFIFLIFIFCILTFLYFQILEAIYQSESIAISNAEKLMIPESSSPHKRSVKSEVLKNKSSSNKESVKSEAIKKISSLSSNKKSVKSEVIKNIPLSSPNKESIKSEAIKKISSLSSNKKFVKSEVIKNISLSSPNKKSIKSETIKKISSSANKKSEVIKKISSSQLSNKNKNLNINIKNSTKKLQKTPFKCKHGVLSKYGDKFVKPIVIESELYRPINFSHAYGCSMNGKYCNGKIKSIPCCIKIMYDSWYAADKYLTMYNVTYSFHWGSLLFAVRNGYHAPWDPMDIDLAFLWPKHAAKKAIDEFMSAYQLKMDGSHHIMDWNQNFYKLHHKIYGWPSTSKKYCFYSEIKGVQNHTNLSRKHIKNKEQLYEMMDNPNGLIVGGTTAFVDFTIGGIKSDGMGNYAKHIEDVNKLDQMIEIEYKGSNGIMPPRKIYIFPDYYKQLYLLYKDDWPIGYNSVFNEKQIKYFGLKEFNNSYFKNIYKITLKKLRTVNKYKYGKLSKVEQENLKKFKNIRFDYYQRKKK